MTATDELAFGGQADAGPSERDALVARLCSRLGFVGVGTAGLAEAAVSS